MGSSQDNDNKGNIGTNTNPTATHSHGLVITVVDDSSLLSFNALLLEAKVFLKYGGKAVPLEQGSLLDHLLPVVWDLLQVKHH